MTGEAELANARVLQEPPRTALLVLAPLLVIVIGFITPPIVPHALYHYPPRVVPIAPWEDGASWLWTIQLGALVLALVALVDVRRRGAPGMIARVTAAVAALAALHVPVGMLYVLRGEAPALSGTSALVVVLTVAALVQAFRTPGWRGWLYALGAYAIATVPYTCPLFPGIFNEFCGGLTFAAADVTLLALIVLGLRR